jgi:hypothetical protein
MDIIKKEKGGTYEGKPRAQKTSSISTRITTDQAQAIEQACQDNQCTKSTLLYSIIEDWRTK